MRKLYLCFVICTIFSLSLQAKLYQGYIITKADIPLTGLIGNINATLHGNEVDFINDFGTLYSLHPALIKGFVYQNGPVQEYYESKLWNNKWIFLRVLYLGESLVLLATPEELNSPSGGFSEDSSRLQDYWLETEAGELIDVNRIGFRKMIRDLIRDVSPVLADQIGQPGYRYKDLYSIIKEYNRICQKGTRRL